MSPSFTRTRAASTRSGPIPNRRTPLLDDPVFVELTAQMSVPSRPQIGDQRLHLGKDLRLDVRGKVAGSRAPQFVVAKSRVNLHHLAADRHL